jgi:RNA polymerase sigma-70 factor (ECF subfamily)
VANGEMEKLGELYLRHSSMVKRALRRTAPEMPSAVADELAQDVFVLLADKAMRYESRMKAKAYLYGIAVKKARAWRRNTWLRRKLLHQARDEGAFFDSEAGQSPLAGVELREVVAQTLSRLPEKQRTVLLLHAVEGFKGEEIANILGVSPKTVRTRLFRARQALLGNVNKEIWVGVLRKEAS